VNLWLSDLDGDGLADEPSSEDQIEVVVERFEFTTGR